MIVSNTMRDCKLGDDANITLDVGSEHVERLYYNNVPFVTIGSGCVMMTLSLRNENTLKNDIVNLSMDKEQAKGLIKGLKKQLRRLGR